jgi:opacity protein-like surface antigen
LVVTDLGAQVTAQIGVGGGAILPAGDYAGTPAEYYAGTKYGLSTGFNLHAKARVGLFGFIVKGEVGYSSLSNSGDAPGGGSVELSHSIITLAAGPEFHLGLPALPITPYLGADLQLNVFSGETVFKGISSVSTGTVTLESATRLGLAVNAGAILSIGPGMKLDLGASYAMMNMFGKVWTDPQPTQDIREDSYGGLNDEKDPLIAVGGTKHFIGDTRSINAIRFTATIMIGI